MRAFLATTLLLTAAASAMAQDNRRDREMPELVVERGGSPVRSRVGHSYIKALMAETGAIFGGSGAAGGAGARPSSRAGPAPEPPPSGSARSVFAHPHTRTSDASRALRMAP